MAKDKKPTKQKMPDYDESFEQLYSVAKRIKLGRSINHLKCPQDGCFACKDLERILNGEGELVGESEYRQDIYVLSS